MDLAGVSGAQRSFRTHLQELGAVDGYEDTETFALATFEVCIEDLSVCESLGQDQEPLMKVH